jgi:hypothetical protein
VGCLIVVTFMGASIAQTFAKSVWRINIDEYRHLLREQVLKEECCREISSPVWGLQCRRAKDYCISDLSRHFKVSESRETGRFILFVDSPLTQCIPGIRR